MIQVGELVKVDVQLRIRSYLIEGVCKDGQTQKGYRSFEVDFTLSRSTATTPINVEA